jgi:hypothetical protein
VKLLQPTLAFATPGQTVCNYGALFFRNLASSASESDSVGSMLRVQPLLLPLTTGSEGGPTATPSNGPATTPGLTLYERSNYKDSFLHSNPYPNTAAPGQPRACEAGNEGYSNPNQVMIGNPPDTRGPITEQTKRVVSKRGQR